MKKKAKTRMLAALLSAAMMCSLCTPTLAAEPAGNGATGKITATVRLDYAQRLDELQRRGIQVELRQGGQNLGSVPLWNVGTHEVDAYEAQVTAKNTDGGDLNGGRWPGYLEVSVAGLPQGSYDLVFTGRGYKSYTQAVTLDDYAKHVTLGTGDGTFTLGDVTGDGKVDEKDRAAVAGALRSSRGEDLLQYDLSGDGLIDIVDLAYVNRLMAAQGGENDVRETVLLAPPAALETIQTELAQRGTTITGELSDIFTDNGSEVRLTSTGGDIVLPLTFREEVKTEEIQIVSPGGPGAIQIGTVLVEEEGKTEPIVLPFDNTLPDGVHATSRVSGSNVITVNLGRRVPVKKVTITVTKTAGGGYAAVEAIQFLKNIVPENPVAPYSVVKGLTAEAGTESVTLKWNYLPNVSGYKVLYWPEENAAEVKELHTDVTSLLVNGLENLETYVFTVTPTDGTWEGKACEPVTATPEPASVPDKVDMVQVTALENALGVSWKKGKSATHYEVYYKEKNSEADWLRAGGKMTQTSTTIPGLLNDVTYSIYVVAYNDVGRGPNSSIYEGTPKAVKYERPEGIPTEGILKNADVIQEIRLADAGNRVGTFDPNYMIDEDYHTAWTAGNWWRNEHVLVTFKEPVDLTAAIWVPRLDGSYPTNLRAYSARVWFNGEDLNGPGHLIVPDPQKGGIDNGGTGRDVDTWPAVRGNAAVTNFAVLPFGPVENVTKISLAVEQRAYTTVSLSELMFMEYDPQHSLPAEITALFADTLHTELAPGVTQEQITALQERLNSDERNYYLDLNTMADELKLAQELLEKGKSGGVLIEGLASRSNSADAKYGQGGSELQPLGVAAAAKQEITIYAEGIPDGEQVNVFASQFNAEASAWRGGMGTLENGRNVLTVPKIDSRAGFNGGSLYFTYSGQNGENIRLHVRRGVDIPTLEVDEWYTMEEAARREAIGAYVDELTAYLGGIKIGSPGNDYRNVTEISTPVVLLSLPALAVNGALGAGTREEKVETLYNSILAWEDIMAICKRTQGIDGVYENNDMRSRQNVRCMTMFAGAFMYAAGNHIGIGYGSCGGMVTGRPISQLEEGAASNRLFGWGIAHEIGHNMDKLGKAEITNNIYSIMVQTYDGKTNILPSRLELSRKYDKIFTKVAQGYPGASNDVFTQLGMYWQLHLAYDNGTEPLDFYNRFFKAWKAGTYTGGATSYDDRVALTAAGVAGRDLTEFFTRWGMSLSDTAKATLAGYQKENRAIWYLNDQSRRDRLNGESGGTGKVTATARMAEGKDNEILISIDTSMVGGKLQGYEIYRNGKPVAFVRAEAGKNAAYTDVIGSGNHRTYAYEVVAFDTLGNQVGSAAKAGEIRVAYDKTVDPSEYSVAVQNGAVVFTMTKETAVSGVKIDGLALTGGNYTVTVTDGEGKTYTALSGSFDADHNQAVDDPNSFLAYFKMPGAENTDTRIWTYDAKTVTVTGIPIGMALENVRLISYPGDDVAFLEGATMGLLAEDYTYSALAEDGSETTETIPKGTLVILGTYRGDPVYNILMVDGRFTGVAAGENGEYEETSVVERPVAGYSYLFAEVPTVGPVSDISDGFFLFVPDVQQEEELQGESSHCDVTNLLPSQIRVGLYRTDNPNDASSKRLTAQTLWINSPGGTREDMPIVVLQGGNDQ